MPRWMHKQAAGTLLLALCACTALAGDPATADAGASATCKTTSAGGRVVVRGTDAALNIWIASWAEETLARLGPVGLKTVLAGPGAVEFVFLPSEQAPSMVTPRVGWVDGRWYCRLELPEVTHLNIEDLREQFCRLMLLDGVRQRSLSSREISLDVVPDWLPAGLAQLTATTEERARNRRVVLAAVERNEAPALQEVLGWRRVPRGWLGPRAFSGMAVAFLVAQQTDVGEFWEDVFTRLAQGTDLDAKWALTRAGGLRSVEVLEQSWREFLSRQERVVQDLGTLSTALFDQLERTVIVTADDVGGKPLIPPGTELAPRDLLSLDRTSVWLRLAAEGKAQKLSALGVGKAPEFVEVVQLYIRFFGSLARGRTRPVVAWQLRRAEQAHRRLAALTRAREAYLDAVEQDVARQSIGAEAEAVWEQLLDKDRLQEYLDAVEQRQRMRAQPAGATDGHK